MQIRFAAWAGSAVVALGLSLGLGSASAAPITFTGNTQLAFDGAAPAPTATLAPGLAYTGSNFNVTESGGFAAIGAPAPGPNNLGWLTLDPVPGSYSGHSVDLRVIFTAPPATGGNPVDVTASVLGSVSSVAGGGVLIDFDNAPHTVNFAGGSFTLSVGDVAITPGVGPVPVTGTILVPEPSTALFGGLGTLLLIRRRRRQA